MPRASGALKNCSAILSTASGCSHIALCGISRGDETPIEGFEQDGYIENAHAGRRSFADLLGEFRLLREANLSMFRNMDDADWQRMGTASGVGVSAKALAFIMSGHVTHHLNILKERYLD